MAFDYTGLPIELRLRILEVLIGTAIWPRVKLDCPRCYAGGDNNKSCEALQRSPSYQPYQDSEDVEYDSEGEEIPELINIDDSDGYTHIEPLEEAPRGLESLAIQTAGWPKAIGVDVPYELTLWYPGCLKPHRLGAHMLSTDGLSKKSSHWMRSLLLISRQFGSDVQKMMWESTFKRFSNPQSLAASIPLLQSVNTTTGFNTLSRVSLSMSNSRLFCLLGFRSSRGSAFTPYNSSREANLDLLTNLKLQHLQFDFQVPVLGRRGGREGNRDPWRHIRDGSPVKASCQKKFVDLFFLMAYDRLRSVPKVTFSGYIQDTNVKTWAGILAGSRKSKPLSHDMSQQISIIMSMPTDKL